MKLPMKTPFTSSFHPPEELTHPALWFIFENEHLLIDKKEDQWHIPLLKNIDHLPLNILQQQYLGMYQQTPCFAVSAIATGDLPESLSFQNLRDIHPVLDDPDLFLLATRAKQILFWDKNTQYCGQCGAKNILSEKEPAKMCSSCHTFFYPQISPVVMALVTRGNEILLARSAHFPEGVYSVLAGFIEPGETAEQAVMREVFEEVGIHVKNIQYVGSQPWPFPSNLMIGYRAEYEGGEIKIDAIEIEHADWYSRENLPPLPKKISLARELIEEFFK